MSIRAVIGETLADIVQTGTFGRSHQELAALLAATGELPSLITFLFAAGRRKRLDIESINAGVRLLEAALDEMRLAINGGHPAAPGHLVAVHQAVARQLTRGGAADELVVRVAHAFSRALLDPGQALRDAVSQAAAESETFRQGPSRQDVEQNLLALATAMGDDPFDIHAELSTLGNMMPPDEHGAMAALLSDAPVRSLRVASLGFALSRDAAVAGEALGAMVSNGEYQPGDRVSSRLRIMRPWLAPARHPALDEAIAAFASLDAGQETDEPAKLVHLLCSCTDGAGSSSIFAVAKSGRKHALLGMLMKRAAGVEDAWAHVGMTKAEVDGALRAIAGGAGASPVSMQVARRVLADALATNLSLDAPPPFGLLNVCERLALGEILPHSVSTESLIGELLQDLPAARTDAAAVRKAHKNSGNWHRHLRMVQSWFEAGPELQALLKKTRPRDRHVAAVLAQALPPRRPFWARNCAWAALILRESAKPREETWIDMALVARDLAGDVAITDIPLAVGIATRTVLAYEQAS